MDQDQFAAIAAMFKVIVPWCLGWFTFYLLTKQANPFKKPEALAKRPKWFLSLGLGLLIGATFSSPTIGIENDFLGMAIVKTTFLAIFMIPVFLGTFSINEISEGQLTEILSCGISSPLRKKILFPKTMIFLWICQASQEVAR